MEIEVKELPKEEQISKFKELWANVIKDFNTSEDMEYYLLSNKWLKAWKKHVGLKESTEIEEEKVEPNQDTPADEESKQIEEEKQPEPDKPAE